MNRLGDLIARLAAHQVEFVLVGGYAAVVYGASFVTRDVDICLRFSPENLGRLRNALEDLNPRHRLTPQKVPFDFDHDSAQRLKNLYLETDWGVLDCLGEVKGIGVFETVLSHSEEKTFPFGKCRVIDLNSLIRAKEAMGRPHDLLTALQLKAIQQSTGGQQS